MANDYSEKYRWEDPDPNSTGVLLSDRIRFYVDRVKLIHPFYPDNLNAASYSLRASDTYYENEVLRKAENGRIRIPKNGLVYVRLLEEINLPHYMIAQHNLKVKQDYRGFLAGRSLLIDPGYRGHINYPIYNFTNQDKEIEVSGNPITEIAFFKTTPFASEAFWKECKIRSEEELDDYVKGQGIDNLSYKLSPLGPDRIIPQYWLPRDTHVSSVSELYEKVDSFSERIKSYEIRETRRFWGLIIGALALFFGAFYFIYNDQQRIEKWVYDATVTIGKVYATHGP
jgi:deoxycytidine triphosphate deaminase